MSFLSRQFGSKLLLISIATSFLVLFCSDSKALPVRLRGELAPPCTSTSGANFKYADLFGDGNIAVQGSYGCKGAFIYNISDPDHPVLYSWYNPGNNQQFLEAIVIGNRAYFGSGNGGGVHIVDLTNPSSPVLLGTVDSTHGNAHNSIHEMVVFDQNGSRFLIENYNSLSNTKILKIINVTNPAAPVFVRDLMPTDPQWVHAMVVRGNRLFTSGWGNSGAPGRTEIYDISNITTQTPTLLGFVADQTAATGNNMHSAWPSDDGNWLYSCREVTSSNGPNPGDLRVYDISNPAQPVLRNSIGMAALNLNAVTPHNPVVNGNFLYVAWYQAGLQVFNISNRANPVRVGQYDTFAGAFAPPAREQQALIDAEPWDLICGTDFRTTSLPTTYDGAWAVYPYLGASKILIGDLTRGLLIVDTTLIISPVRLHIADSDGRGTNTSIYSPNTREWQMADDTLTDLSSFRIAGDIMVTADYDGDEKADIAVFRPSTGVWYIQESTAGSTSIRFGMNGDIPVPADYDSDGKTDIAVWRPSNGTWYVMQSIVGFRAQQWGTAGDKPLTGDYDGDGKADMAVWRPSTGMWCILPSTAAIPVYQQFGQSGDRPMNADFDGNGTSDFAVYRPSNGSWYILDPVTRAFTSYNFGTAEDMPIPADFDGDGKDDIAVFRPSNSFRYGLNSSTGDLFADEMHSINDQPAQLSNRKQ